MDPRILRIEDYTYDLPEDKIAHYPLPERDASKMLIYKNGQIDEQQFRNLPQYLPEKSLLIFNQTKVVHARLLFRKPTGGIIEIFCLEPDNQYADVPTAMLQKGKVYWQCIVGGAAKWKNGIELVLTSNQPPFTLSAKIFNRSEANFIIEFSWDDTSLSFAEILQATGKMPIPPYLNREADETDENRYQTVFAKDEGSVAAPTASLHFTRETLDQLADKKIDTALLTLHVGAGTFKPVKAETIGGHDMHSEWLEVDSALIKSILSHSNKPIIAVGTTALRTLESLYWIGCKLIENPGFQMEQLQVSQWEPYQSTNDISTETSLRAILQWMDKTSRKSIVTKTQILIAPGYQFKIVQGLITNFHQPQSTLLLLVAALIGDDWKEVYKFALNHNFRFLSYGDSSLLWANQ